MGYTMFNAARWTSKNTKGSKGKKLEDLYLKYMSMCFKNEIIIEKIAASSKDVHVCLCGMFNSEKSAICLKEFWEK